MLSLLSLLLNVNVFLEDDFQTHCQEDTASTQRSRSL